MLFRSVRLCVRRGSRLHPSFLVCHLKVFGDGPLSLSVLDLCVCVCVCVQVCVCLRKEMGQRLDNSLRSCSLYSIWPKIELLQSSLKWALLQYPFSIHLQRFLSLEGSASRYTFFQPGHVDLFYLVPFVPFRKTRLTVTSLLACFVKADYCSAVSDLKQDSIQP